MRMNHLSEFQMGYMAALIDGEGCISLGRTYRPRLFDFNYMPMVSVANCATEMMDWCLKTTALGVVDTRSTLEKNRRRRFSWRLRVPEIRGFLTEIGPRLVVKQEQSDLMLEFFEKCQWAAGRPVPDVIIRLRGFIYEELKVLNKRGERV
jgi:hypothetical protein